MTAMWVIYFADIVDNLAVVARIISVFFGMAWAVGVMIGFVWVQDGRDADKQARMNIYKKAATKSAIILAGALLVSIFTPSSKTIYMMAAAKVGQDIVESPQTKEISGKVLLLINQKLDEQLTKKAER